MTATPLKPFTPQQLRICAGISRGLSYRQIAREMGISHNTVRGHVRVMGNRLWEPQELPPRHRLLLWIKHREWEDTRPTTRAVAA